MSVKSKVLKVELVKEFQTKAGTTMYSWNVVTEAGDIGTTNTTKKEAPWNVGDEAEYDVEKTEYNGNTFTKLKKVYAQGGGGFGGGGFGGGKKWTPDPERETRKERIARQLLIVRQSSVSAANELIRTGSGKATTENLLATAAAIEAWVLRKDVPADSILSRMAKSGQQPAQQPVPAAPAQATTTLDAAANYAQQQAAPQAAPQQQAGPVATSPLGEDGLPF